MPADYLTNLGTIALTGTSATVTSTAFNTLTGAPRRGLNLRCRFSAVSCATGACTALAKVQYSPDGTNYADAVFAVPFTLNATAQTGVLDIAINPTHARPWIRTIVSHAVTTGTPTGTYIFDLTAARPG